MTQTHKDYEAIESEHLAEIERLQSENDHLRYTIRKMYECARQWEWGSYYLNTPEAFIYQTAKREVKR